MASHLTAPPSAPYTDCVSRILSGLRKRLDFLLVIACALTARAAFGLLVANTYDYDEFVTLLLARDYAHGQTPYRDFMLFQPPGVLVVFRLLQPLTSFWWPVGRIFTMCVDTATAGLVWKIGKVIFERRIALLAGLLYAISPLALIASAFHGKERGVAFGIYGGVIGAAVAVGPVVGGVITSSIGWEWLFFVNVPIGIGAVAPHAELGGAAFRQGRSVAERGRPFVPLYSL